MSDKSDAQNLNFNDLISSENPESKPKNQDKEIQSLYEKNNFLKKQFTQLKNCFLISFAIVFSLSFFAILHTTNINSKTNLLNTEISNFKKENNELKAKISNLEILFQTYKNNQIIKEQKEPAVPDLPTILPPLTESGKFFPNNYNPYSQFSSEQQQKLLALDFAKEVQEKEFVLNNLKIENDIFLLNKEKQATKFINSKQ